MEHCVWEYKDLYLVFVESPRDKTEGKLIYLERVAMYVLPVQSLSDGSNENIIQTNERDISCTDYRLLLLNDEGGREVDVTLS